MLRSEDYVSSLDKDTLKDAMLVLESVEAASKRSEKEKLLKENKDNPVLQEFLFRALGKEKYYVTVKDEILSEENRMGAVESYQKFLKALRALSSRKVSGNDARERIESFLARSNPRLRTWYQRVLNHNLRMGISKSTVEKIYGTGFWFNVEEGEFHPHGCCLAKKYEDVYKKGNEPEFPLAAEFKLDGSRALIFVYPEDGHIEVYSRDGIRNHELESMDVYTAQCVEFVEKLGEIAGLPAKTPIFIDGEFMGKDWNETSSIIHSSKNFDPEAFLSKIRTVLWDWSTIDAYIVKQFDVGWKKRKQQLMRAAGATRPFEKVMKASDHLYVMGYRLVYNMDELIEFYEWALDAGFEGIMLKQMDAPHVFHRKHKYVIKMKPEDEETGEILEVVSGEGKNAAASAHDKRKIKKELEDCGFGEDITDDGYYLHVNHEDMEQEDADGLAETLRGVVKDAVDRRISTHIKNTVSYRYGPRLGYFVVKWKEHEIHVGGGFSYKAGSDQRMDFWQDRDNLVGVKIDFKMQRDKSDVAKARFNKFVRLRKDI